MEQQSSSRFYSDLSLSAKMIRRLSTETNSSTCKYERSFALKKLVALTIGLYILFTSQANVLAESKKMKDIINDLLNISYQYGGSTKEGFDCSGFTKYVFEEFGITLPHSSTEQFNSDKEVSKTELRPGDLVFFDTSGKNGISHVGIYMGENKFAHASTTKGTCIDKMNTDYYSKRYIGACRVMSE